MATERINLDELLGEFAPVLEVTISHRTYQFWNPKHLNEAEFLKFIDAQASLFEAMKSEIGSDEVGNDANKLLDLYIEQQRMSGRSLPPTRRYLEVLARVDEGTFKDLIPAQTNKLFNLINPLIQEKSEDEEGDEAESEGKEQGPKKRSRKPKETSEPSAESTLAA